MNLKTLGFGLLLRQIPVIGMALAVQSCLLNEDFRVSSADPLSPNPAGGSGASTNAGTAQGGVSSSHPSTTIVGNGGVSTSSTCSGTATWTTMARPPLDFVARERAAVATFNGKVFVFGGVDTFGAALDTGAIYDLKTDSWELLPIDANTPEPRQAAAAAYAGGKILVWGGKSHSLSDNRFHMYSTGASYDPQTRKWSHITDAWVARAAPIAATDGTRVVFFGGYDSNFTSVGNGSLFSMTTSTWDWMNSDNSPGNVDDPTVITNSTGLFVYGGAVDSFGYSDRAFNYDFSQNKWTSISNGPSARFGAFGAWDGSHVYVWGGFDKTGALNDGRLFGRSWIEMAPASPQKARGAAYGKSGWAYAVATDDITFLGGFDASGNVQKGGLRYKRSPESWSPIPAWPSGEEHVGAAGVWVGAEFVLIGGRNDKQLTTTGERLRLCN